MRIGLDLDNTIVCYDRLFHECAVEQSLLPDTVAATKTAIRDYFRNGGREEVWTRLQGAVYGPQMRRAEPFSGFQAFVEQAQANRCELRVVSHRSRAPYLGPAHDLHESARQWIQQNAPSIDSGDVYLELTREAKMHRIEQLQCDVFVDDLPELLSDAQFPRQVRRIWFNPDWRDFAGELESIAGWSELAERLQFP